MLKSEDENVLPQRFMLYPNFPNPFNPTTQIRFELPKDELVSIEIYDVMGRNIRSIMNVKHTAGYNSFQWDARNDFGRKVTAGMYIYYCASRQYKATKKDGFS